MPYRYLCSFVKFILLLPDHFLCSHIYFQGGGFSSKQMD